MRRNFTYNMRLDVTDNMINDSATTSQNDNYLCLQNMTNNIQTLLSLIGMKIASPRLFSSSYILELDWSELTMTTIKWEV